MTQKVAIITAASSGIGAACARELASRGYAVSLLARSEAVIHLAKDLNGIGTRGSVSNVEDLQRLLDATLHTFGRIDAVVNNTGHPAKGELLELTDQDWQDGMDLILLSVIRLARLVTPLFEANGGGALVNISSFAAPEPSLLRPISSVLRAGLSSFTKIYSDRYAAKNIRMNSVLPGWTDSYPVAEQDLAQIPMCRAAETQEIAKAVAFLLSSDASYITGTNLAVDGGLLRSL